MRKSLLAASAAPVAGLLVGMSPLLGASSALAAACVIAPVSTYTAPGFSCSVGPVTFSNISVHSTTSGSGTVTLGDFTPFTIGNENGLDLSYAANTGTTAGSAADVAWIYNVSGAPSLIDAFASLTSITTGTGTANLAETLSNGTTLSLSGPGTTSATFAAIGSLGVTKDQNNFSGSAGSADSSILGNGFSVSTIPEPSTWAMMALGFAGLGFVGFRSRRSQRFAAIV